MTNYTKSIKHRIAGFLNSATTAVLQSYERYLKADLPETTDQKAKEPAAFKQFHDAGKSAASHLESLLKLAAATEDPKESEKQADEDADQNAQQAMQNAKDELEGR